ncbi:MAG: YafY family protein [Bacteroidota bacterium]
MKRIERLTAIVAYLQSRRYTSIEDLQDKFEVSERTLYRDLRSLETAGTPIAFEKDRGYYIVGGHFLPPMTFTLEEAKSFIFVEQLARKYIDPETFERFSSALLKIKHKLKESQLESWEQLEEKVGVYIGKEESARFMPLAEQACTHRHVLRMQYRDIMGRPSERKIEPIGITFYSQTWHVIAWCQLRKAYRDFSLARVEDLQPTSEIFGEGHLSLAEYIQQLQASESD